MQNAMIGLLMQISILGEVYLNITFVIDAARWAFHVFGNGYFRFCCRKKNKKPS